MIRPVLTEVVIFLLPFAVYAVFLVATRYQLLATASWPIHVIGSLIGVALALTIVAMLLFVHYSGAPPGLTYTPAHMENGKLVPGVEK